MIVSAINWYVAILTYALFWPKTFVINDSMSIKCQAVAAVVLNNPNGFEKINVTTETRFDMLNNRAVDLLAAGDTHTIEREVLEVL
jgi:hypothetical protein